MQRLALHKLACVFSAFLFAAPAIAQEDGELPLLQDGDVISADVLNDAFQRVNAVQVGFKAAAELVGTWTATYYAGNMTNASFALDPQTGFYTREDTVTFADQGGGVFTFTTANWSLAGNSDWRQIPILASDTANPIMGDDLTQPIMGDDTANPIFGPDPQNPTGPAIIIGYPQIVTGYAQIIVGYPQIQVGVTTATAQEVGQYGLANSRLMVGIGGSPRPFQLLKYNAYRFSAEVGNETMVVFERVDRPPISPAALTASTAGLDVTLDWTDRATTETGFKVLRKDLLSGSYQVVGAVSPDVDTFSQTVLAGEHWYRIVATNAHGDSLGSNVVKVTVP